MEELKMYEIEASESMHYGSFSVVDVFSVVAYSYEEAIEHIKKHTNFRYFTLMQELDLKDGEYTVTSTSGNL